MFYVFCHIEPTCQKLCFFINTSSLTFEGSITGPSHNSSKMEIFKNDVLETTCTSKPILLTQSIDIVKQSCLCFHTVTICAFSICFCCCCCNIEPTTSQTLCIYDRNCFFVFFALFEIALKLIKKLYFLKYHFVNTFLCHTGPTFQKLRFYKQNCNFSPLRP